jgi:WD40 repeat protein
LWDLATGETTVLEPPIGLIHLGLKGSSVLSPDGKTAYFAGRREYAVGVLDIERGTWSELKGEREAKGPGEVTFIHEFLSQVTLSDDGKYLAATGMYRPTMLMPSLEVKPEVFVWETSSRKQVQRLRGVSGSGTMRFMPDGSRIVVGKSEGRLEFWNVAKGEREREFGTAAGEALQDFAISPDGKLIVTTSTFSDLNRNVKQREAYLQVWDVATGKEQMRLTSPSGWGRTELSVAKDWSRLAWWVSGDQGILGARMKALPGERRDRSGGEVWVWDVALTSHGK